MLISHWIDYARQQLKACGIESYNLDAKLLLKHLMGLSDMAILSDDIKINNKNLKDLNLLLQRRLSGEPIAYLTNNIEFFGRDFFVDNRVLIPRIETEQIIGGALSLKLRRPKILDVGTGSGIIGINLALEIPESEVTLSDLSSSALDVANLNMNKYIDQIKLVGSSVNSLQSNLLAKFANQKFDLIVANLPYVNKSWPWLDINRLSYEPQQAIFAEDSGLRLIKKLVDNIKNNLSDSGFLILEMDPSQISTIKIYAIKKGFKVIHHSDNNLNTEYNHNLYTLMLKNIF